MVKLLHPTVLLLIRLIPVRLGVILLVALGAALASAGWAAWLFLL